MQPSVRLICKYGAFAHSMINFARERVTCLSCGGLSAFFAELAFLMFFDGGSKAVWTPALICSSLYILVILSRFYLSHFDGRMMSIVFGKHRVFFVSEVLGWDFVFFCVVFVEKIGDFGRCLGGISIVSSFCSFGDLCAM